MEVIAHRGANKEAFENSPTALNIAAELGIKRIELDVHRTSDGVFIINHDDNLEHATGKNLTIRSATIEQIERIPLKNGEPIPLLHDVLRDLLPKVELNIEVKFGDLTGIKPLTELVATYDAQRIVFSSFHRPIMGELASFSGPWRLALLEEFSHQTDNALRFCRENHIAIIHPYYKMVTDTFMAKAREQGLKVFPYTGMVDEDSDQRTIWQNLRELGIDGLCTNYPRELKQWLAETT